MDAALPSLTALTVLTLLTCVPHSARSLVVPVATTTYYVLLLEGISLTSLRL